MYGGSTQLNIGMAPMALIGLHSIGSAQIIWFMLAAAIPLMAVLVFGLMFLRQELTEAEAMDVSDKTLLKR